MSNLPKPIVWALSIIIVAIGLGIGFQIFKGAGFSYDGALGNISIGELTVQAGDEEIKVNKLFSDTENALRAAEQEITSQQQTIDALETRLSKSQQEVERLLALSMKLSRETRRTATAAERSTIESASRSLAATATSEAQTSEVTTKAAQTRTTIQEQLSRYNKVDLNAKLLKK